jgi:hypothetical protein
MSGSSAPEIGIVNYPGAQVAPILGLTDLFGIASTIALDQRRSGQTGLRVTHWKPIDSFDTNLSCVYDSAPRGSPQPRILIIPPTLVNLPNPDVPAGALVQIAGAGKRPVLYCRDFKLGARHSALQAQVDLGDPDVPVRIVPCGCDASIRYRRS